MKKRIFNEYKKLSHRGHSVFVKDSSTFRQGEFLCRLGFPFPEFPNFKFKESTDDIEWGKEGVSSFNLFSHKRNRHLFSGQCIHVDTIKEFLKVKERKILRTGVNQFT